MDGNAITRAAEGGKVMSKYIRAVVAAMAIEEKYGIPLGDLVDTFADIPAADVMEVVRCRECVHWKPIGNKAGNSFSDMEYVGGCEFTKYCRRESDFCSYGERKEGAD